MFTHTSSQLQGPITRERPWWTHVVFYRLWDGQDCCSEAILKADYSGKPAFDRYRDWIANHSVRHGTVLPVMAR